MSDSLQLNNYSTVREDSYGRLLFAPKWDLARRVAQSEGAERALFAEMAMSIFHDLIDPELRPKHDSRVATLFEDDYSELRELFVEARKSKDGSCHLGHLPSELHDKVISFLPKKYNTDSISAMSKDPRDLISLGFFQPTDSVTFSRLITSSTGKAARRDVYLFRPLYLHASQDQKRVLRGMLVNLLTGFKVCNSEYEFAKSLLLSLFQDATDTKDEMLLNVMAGLFLTHKVFMHELMEMIDQYFSQTVQSIFPSWTTFAEQSQRQDALRQSSVSQPERLHHQLPQRREEHGDEEDQEISCMDSLLNCFSCFSRAGHEEPKDPTPATPLLKR
jgi:hypothetical protein